jgi:hypothetical protein
VKVLSRIAIAFTCAIVGLALMGAAYDKPQWHFVALGIVGVLVFVGGPHYALMSKRAGTGSDQDA